MIKGLLTLLRGNFRLNPTLGYCDLGGLSIFPTFAMKTKGKGNNPHKETCRPSLDSHPPHPKKPRLESLKEVFIVDHVKGRFLFLKMVHMEEWKVAKDIFWVKQVGLSSFLSVMRGLLRNLFVIRMKEHLIPRCKGKNSPCFRKPYYEFSDSKRRHP